MFRAVVFDMDGVITDTEKLYRRFQLEEGKKLGIPDDVMVVACERIAGGTKYTNKKSFEDVVGMGIDYFDFREAVVNWIDVCRWSMTYVSDLYIYTNLTTRAL